MAKKIMENASLIQAGPLKEITENISVRNKTSFLGDVLRLVSGTAIAQGLTVLISPFLTRLYSPEDFGVLALFTAVTNIIIVISCMRYQYAIMLPETDNDAVNVLAISMLSVVVVSIISIFVILFGEEMILHLLNFPAMSKYLWLIPLMVFLGGSFLALNYWNSRTKHFTRLAIAQSTTSVATASIQLGAGYAGYATGGALIGANVVGHAVSTLVLGGQIWKDDRRIILNSVNWKNMFFMLRKYKKFPLLNTWSALLNTASWQVPAILLGAFFSPVIVGFYALGFRVLKTPMSLIGTSIGQVFYQRTATAKHNATLGSLVEKAFRSLVMISFFPFLVLTVIGKDLFSVIFGSNWAEAGTYVQILSIWVFFWFISSPLTTIYVALEKLEQGLLLNLVIFLTRIISIVIGGLLHNIYLALGVFALSGTIVYGRLVMWNLRLAGVNIRSNIMMLFRCMLFFSPPLMFLYFLKTLNVDALWIVLAAAIELVVYYLIVMRIEPQLFQIFKKVFSKR